MLKNNNHHSISLQNAYNKYGKDNVFFKIIEECDAVECIEKEQFYIDKYNSFNKGYNGRPIANSNLGFKQTDNFFESMQNKYKKIRDTYYPEIKKLYDENKTTREISAIMNLSRTTITKVFKENNIKGKNIAFYKKIRLFQYTINGEFIKEWDNINLCSSSINTKPNAIKDVINGRSKHSKGFYFSLTKLSQEEILNNINTLVIKSKNRKFFNIKQLDLSGKYIKTWRDVKEITQHFGFTNIAGITRALNGKSNGKYKNFYWKL